jgi:ATPase subunit of ABC transporter with duplicated ATPase domains
MTMIIGMVAVGSGCKSKKKAMEAAAAEKARLEQEAELKRQQEEAARREAEERARREAEERARAEAAAPRAKLEQYFRSIANSSNAASANRSISEALTLFASDETPVLIVISESGGIKDYDRPTTIKQYLEYLKDTGKNINRIGNVQYDSAGKITELELIK